MLCAVCSLRRDVQQLSHMNERITIPEGTAFNAIGQPVRRKEDQRLLTGKGRFTDDFSLDGQAYAAMVRSPHAHARIKRIDTAKAKAMPGVLGVFTGADVRADGLEPLPHSAVPSTKFDMKLGPPAGRSLFIGPNVLMPADKTRHVGEAVAMVVAQTRAQAMDAAEAVEVEYEELPFVLHSGDALKPGAPAVWDEAADNVLIDTQFGDKAATDAAFAAADSCGEEGIQHRPRHRGDDGAALGARPLRSGDAALHALLPAAAAR